jgi:hypothetical protein
MVAVRSLSVLIVVCALSGASAQELRVSAKTDSETFPLGGWIDVHVHTASDAAIDSIAPVVRDSIGPFEVMKIERNAATPDWLVRVTSIDSGKLFLPPIEFRYRIKNDTTFRSAYSNALMLTIAGVTFDPKGDIKDIKPPKSAPWLFEDFLPYLIGLVVLAALAAAYYYYRRWKKQKTLSTEKVTVAIPPHREALTALRILEEKKLWQQGMVKEYYSEVTEIVRRFFERRWEILALESTTDEILEQLRHVPEALNVWKEMEAFFSTADLVKFAKSQPSPADHDREMHTAYDIVRAMVPPEPQPSEQAPQEVNADVR